MKLNYILMPMLAMALLASCKQKNEEPMLPTADTVAAEVQAEVLPEEEKPVELVPVIRDVKPVRQAAASTNTKPAAKQAPANGKAETIYVETDGAQGRVWGHVTMKGDRGTGTIHDWDENTWAVTVTRHGDELYAVDQNSRLYVFKSKQNKTQQ